MKTEEEKKAAAAKRKALRAAERASHKRAMEKLAAFAQGSGNYYSPHVYLQTTRG